MHAIAPSTDSWPVLDPESAEGHRPVRPWRGAKIVASLGPACHGLDDVCNLARAGVDVFRLDFSHGSHADHQQRLHWVRDAEQQVGRPLGALLDLQGPKLHIGCLAAPIALQAGTELVLRCAAQQALESDPVPVPHEVIFQALAPGHQMLVDDGKLRFTVLCTNGEQVRVRSDVAGVLHEHKGISLPDSVLPMSALCTKDLEDLAFGLALGVDWIALGFVQTEEDVMQLRELVQGRAGLISRIENPSALKRLEAILHASDAVMIARGGLGAELSPEDIPGVQRRITQLAREMGKPVIVATQMLTSMIESPSPTRAEVSDVATAVYDGVDAVMLSAETSSGHYPQQTVRMMVRIIAQVESDPRQPWQLDAFAARPQAKAINAIGAAVRAVAQTVPLSATVVYTSSGASALHIARERPQAPLIALSPRANTARRLALVWGVRPLVSREAVNMDDMVMLATAAVNNLCADTASRTMAIVAGMPFGTPGATNLLRLVMPG